MFSTSAIFRRGGGEVAQGSHLKHVLMHPDQIWSMLEEAREKRCSLPVVARLRGEESQGGANDGSVEYWNRKVLGLYFGKSKTAFLNLPHLNLVTDASTFSQKDTIVTIAYNHELDICTLCPVQVVSRSKVVSALEFDLEPEIEQLAATRQVDRLASYRFLCAISNQISQLTSGKLSLPSFVAPLSMYLGPLQEDKKRITQGGHVFIKDVGTGNICQPDLSDVMNVPILSVSIDQGGVGAASWLTILKFLFNWDTCDFDNFIFP